MPYLFPGTTLYPRPGLYPLGWIENDICKVHVFLTHDLAIWTAAAETNDLLITAGVTKEVAITTDASVGSDLAILLSEQSTRLTITVEVFNNEF